MSLIRFAAFSALVLPLTASATDLVVDAPCLSEPFVLSLDDLTYEETLESRGVFLGVYGMPPTVMEGVSLTRFELYLDPTEEQYEYFIHDGTGNVSISLYAISPPVLPDVSPLPQRFRRHYDFPFVFLPGSASCEVSQVLTGDPLATEAPRLAAAATEAWDARYAPFTTLTAERVETDLQPVLDTLVTGGCQVTDLVENGVAGAYGDGLVTGQDIYGDIQDGVFRPGFGARLGDGTRVGTLAGLPVRFRRGKLYARTDTGFLVGRYVARDLRHGMFYAVATSCDGGNAGEVLEAWFGADLP